MINLSKDKNTSVHKTHFLKLPSLSKPNKLLVITFFFILISSAIDTIQHTADPTSDNLSIGNFVLGEQYDKNDLDSEVDSQIHTIKPKSKYFDSMVKMRYTNWHQSKDEVNFLKKVVVEQDLDDTLLRASFGYELQNTKTCQSTYDEITGRYEEWSNTSFKPADDKPYANVNYLNTIIEFNGYLVHAGNNCEEARRMFIGIAMSKNTYDKLINRPVTQQINKQLFSE